MTHRITVSMPDDVHDALVDQAESENRTVSSIVVHHVRNNMVAQDILYLPWAAAVTVARDAIRGGFTDDFALRLAREKYPTLTIETVEWVRWDLRIVREEEGIPRDREARDA